MFGIPNPGITGLRIKNASSHAEEITQHTGRQAFLSQPQEVASCPVYLLQGMVETGCHSYMPSSEMNPGEKFREDISDKLKPWRLTFLSLIPRGGPE